MTRTLLLPVGLFFSLVCGFSSAAADKNDPKKADPEKTAKNKLISGGVITGRLTRVEGAQKYISVQVTLTVVVPTGGNPANSLALLQQQQAMMRERNPIARQRLLLQILQTAGLGGGNFQVQHITRDIELQASDEMKVRTLLLPVDFDEKGRPKRYTAKELQDLKGDPKLPGYTADFDSLKPDQLVQVHLLKKKDEPKTAAKEKAKDQEKDKEPASEDRREIAMIVILRDASK